MTVGKVAAGKCGVVHDVKKMQQIIPFITCEIDSAWDVCELVFGFDILDLDF